MRIAVVGSRGFGTVHLAAMSRLRDEGLDIEYYTFSSSEQEARALAERFGAAGHFTNYDDVLSSGVDAVDLVVSHDAHVPMALKAFSAGKHVMLEKPIARSMEEAEAIVKAAEEHSLKFMVAENYHFNETFNELYRRLPSIGRVHTAIVRDIHFNQPRGWRKVREQMGGGAVIDGGIHMIHVMLNAMGDYSSVCSTVYRSGAVDMEGEDVGIAIFNFRSGAKGVYMYGWAFKDSPGVPIIEVYGDRGSIYEDPGSRLFMESRGFRYFARHGDLVVNGQRVEVPRKDMIAEEVRAFADYVDGRRRDNPMPTELELRDLRAVLDMYFASSKC
ncbi:MAG: Gfo/Idh/MocA family oxidoreductase [Acidilobus sp.]